MLTFAAEIIKIAIMTNKVETFQYRNSHPTVTIDDYFKATKVEFTDIAADADIDAIWQSLAEQGCEWHKSPLSDSEYMINRQTGDIYRKSSHWGKRISTCCWTLRRGKVSLTMCYTIGKANISDFEAIITPDYMIRYYMSNL